MQKTFAVRVTFVKKAGILAKSIGNRIKKLTGPAENYRYTYTYIAST